MFSRPSVTTVLSVAFLGYMGHSIWSMAQLFIPPHCGPGQQCLENRLHSEPDRDVLIFSSLSRQPSLEKRDLTFVKELKIRDLEEEIKEEVRVELPQKVRNNGTFYLCVFTVPAISSRSRKLEEEPLSRLNDPDATYTMVPLTLFQVPEAETFNLLGSEQGPKEDNTRKPKSPDLNRERPVTHLRSKITISMMTDPVSIPKKEAPPEFYWLMRVSGDQKHYLPIVYIDELSLRLRDLVIVNQTDTHGSVEFLYRPISYGKLRLFLQFTGGLAAMHGMGFTEKDTDEVKGIFADTNMVLLLVTFGVSAVHLLFDFLAFKNDISFWRNKKTMEGLSTTTVLWRAFSQSIIFLYLMDEQTSLLVLIPSGVAALIEIWKVTKAFKFSLTWSTGILPKVSCGSSTDNEKSTEAFDSESMKYLSYLLYPLCIGGAGYSLYYTPHKSWWSWTIQSTVNGVYAFGFLFMLPQLFVNYKLKSVAHLPWRAFMYKAFNTFIDDLFAFIITMPTAHRVACFRDDIVFLIYLYQRYLYPVDTSRIDVSGMIEETTDTKTSEKKENKKTQ